MIVYGSNIQSAGIIKEIRNLKNLENVPVIFATDEFNEDLYGKIIKINFVKKIRDEQNFGSLKLLGQQINKDYEQFEMWAKVVMNQK